MKRSGKTLDVKTLKALRPRAQTYRVSDGGGLLLEVRPSGAKMWLCRLTVRGKRRDMAWADTPWSRFPMPVPRHRRPVGLQEQVLTRSRADVPMPSPERPRTRRPPPFVHTPSGQWQKRASRHKRRGGRTAEQHLFGGHLSPIMHTALG